MISDLTSVVGQASSLSCSPGLVVDALDGQCVTHQPVTDVQAYLAERRTQPTPDGETGLLITLSADQQSEVRALVRACEFIAGMVRDGSSVQAACKAAIKIHAKRGWKLNTFRPKFDAWSAKKDWVVLVNRSKAPVSWRKGNVGLPEAFLGFCEIRFAKFGREDGKRQAWLSISKHWRVGRDDDGRECVIPGYEKEWSKRDRENCPTGWSYDNITEQIRKRNRFNKATRAMLHESESAARQFLPQIIGDRRNLRFLEKITFDDVRMDWLVFNAATGRAEELWLLVARDEATAMVLGFVMHPATVDEFGKASHLGARQMKELAAYLLERYPLPPYAVHWVVERGTATLAEGVKTALGELFNDRIKVHYTSMVGDKSPRGYKEKAKGNSRGKASHEAHNRLFHTQASRLPGQTGANYGIRPADLEARVKECNEIWELRQRLPEHKRGDVKFPLVVLQTEARNVIQEFCIEQNFRRDHALQGFDQVLEWFDGQKWQPRETAPAGVEFKARMEMPVERALRLIRFVEKWDRISPAVIKTFLEHTERLEIVNEKGEIKIQIGPDKLTFCHGGVPLTAGTKVLCYHHPEDPEFLHLTSGDGRILGTWYQRGRTAYLDQEALARAMRYTHAARTAAMDTARDLGAPQVAELEAMRQHNAALEQFTVTADVPAAIGAETGSTAAASLITTRQDIKRRKQAEDKFIREVGQDAADTILSTIDPTQSIDPAQPVESTPSTPSTDSTIGADPSAGDDFLSAISQ
jgi:hypothetical protein